jgi:hypothetical protein
MFNSWGHTLPLYSYKIVALEVNSLETYLSYVLSVVLFQTTPCPDGIRSHDPGGDDTFRPRGVVRIGYVQGCCSSSFSVSEK